MHVMFVHPNFPAQFGHIAHHLATRLGWPCTFVTSVDTTQHKLPFSHINYRLKPGQTPKTFFNPSDLTGLFEHMDAIYKGMKSVPQIQPDLVVGHMSYGTMLYLRNLYSCPFLGYYELLPPPFWSEKLVLRREFPPPERVRLFNARYHAFTYLHLHMVDAAYTPTHFQLSTAPAELQYKLRVIFDGVDTQLFDRRPPARPLEFGGRVIGPETRVVTYVSRGLESARGFDIFMKVAKRLCEEIDDLLVFVAGDERSHYGHESHHIGGQTFKQYVLSQDEYDLERIVFLGRIPVTDLATMYSLSDLHIYLTVPFVLSWSLVQAMSAGCTILGSTTPPVQEVIDSGVHGLLEGFDDVDGLTERALEVLRDPDGHRHLGQAARQRVLERYEKNRCIEQLIALFEATQAGGGGEDAGTRGRGDAERREGGGDVV